MQLQKRLKLKSKNLFIFKELIDILQKNIMNQKNLYLLNATLNIPKYNVKNHISIFIFCNT